MNKTTTHINNTQTNHKIQTQQQTNTTQQHIHEISRNIFIYGNQHTDIIYIYKYIQNNKQPKIQHIYSQNYNQNNHK